MGKWLNQIKSKKTGTVYDVLARGIENWEKRRALSVEGTFSDRVRTVAGDDSIKSDEPARVVSIFARTDFSATKLVITQFNQLDMATAVGTGFYMLVPALPFGSFGTAEKPNGMLFTDNQGNNLRPTVYFKPLTSGVPTSINDGTLCSYQDAEGYRFYTTSQPGYLIVSGITYADTCAHIGWSGRYNEFVAPVANRCSEVALTSLINKVHSYGVLLSIAGGPSDGIVFGDQVATCYRYNDRVKPVWSTEAVEGESGTRYIHSATIDAMKEDGAVECGSIELSVSGKTISYESDSDTPTNDYVKYELATVVTATETISPLLDPEDWGLEMLVGASGSAYVTMRYAQNFLDALAALASTLHSWNIRVLAEGVAWLSARISALESLIDNAGDLKANSIDTKYLPKVCGYPLVIKGAGAPTVTPRFVGQRYHNTTDRKVYEAMAVTNSISDWVLLN